MSANIYDKLILNTRLKPSSQAYPRNINEEFTSDKARIIFSSPFRRLQQKTQVFSLETNASVRSRLTHTLEVATIGISIAEKICEKLKAAGLIKDKQILPFIRIVENACLLHDIGNPPFGHFAEEAIKKWFSEKWKLVFHIATKIPEIEIPNLEINNTLIKDFYNFDGNPQGLRIVTKLQDIKFPNSQNSFTDFGMNLTVSQIASLVKYTASPNTVDKSVPLLKKTGFFYSEKKKLDEVKKILNLKFRYPLTYIMEAADDISYCLSDIEDGIEKQVLTSRYFFEKLVLEYKENCPSGGKYSVQIENKKSKEDFFQFRIDLIRDVESHAADRYVQKHESILNGNLTELIDKDSEEGKMLKCLKQVSRKFLFRSKEAENKELAGYHAIFGLLDKYQKLLELEYKKFMDLVASKQNINSVLGAGMDLEWRLFNKLPEKYLDAYLYEYNILKSNHDPSSEEFKQYEWYYRAHLIIDYISSMTDNYVIETYNLLYGIKI